MLVQEQGNLACIIFPFLQDPDQFTDLVLGIFTLV